MIINYIVIKTVFGNIGKTDIQARHFKEIYCQMYFSLNIFSEWRKVHNAFFTIQCYTMHSVDMTFKLNKGFCMYLAPRL